MRWYEDVDGNFIEQFQTNGFDSRIWELYLFATLVELGFAMDRSVPAPDFVAWSLRGDIAIEATTVNPTRDKTGAIVPPPSTDTDAGYELFMRGYMPMKFGSALYSKLTRRYWEKGHMRDRSLVFAVEDFSAPSSMLFTRSALQTYLYGYEHEFRHDKAGRLLITPHRVESHHWGEKTIPSGFFFLPDAEHISAVIFSNSGTVSKFNRMGVVAGFGSDHIRMVREGFLFDHDPNAAEPKHFRVNVRYPEYRESWVEGLEVYHNPRALRPLDPLLLPGAAHIRLLEDGQVDARLPSRHPASSRTLILAPEDAGEMWRDHE